MNEPWLEKNNWGEWEVNAGDGKLTVNCSANQIIEIDKLYGPLAAFGVRIRLEYANDVADWVVEREKLDDSAEGRQWIEMCRWDCQLDWPEKD